MKTICLVTFVLTLLCVQTSQAAIQMDYLGYENGDPVFTITGGEGYYGLYLQCLRPDATITEGGDGHVQITDLGVTAKQNHLFSIVGRYGSPFSVNSQWPSVVEVLDVSMSKIGVYAYTLDRYFRADAGGPYSIAPGQSVLLDSSQSYLVDYGWTPADSLLSPDFISAQWEIDGQTVGSSVTFDELVGTFGLGYGVHTVQMDATTVFGEFGFPYEATAYSTIEILPEPTTLALLAFGGPLIRRKK